MADSVIKYRKSSRRKPRAIDQTLILSILNILNCCTLLYNKIYVKTFLNISYGLEHRRIQDSEHCQASKMEFFAKLKESGGGVFPKSEIFR